MNPDNIPTTSPRLIKTIIVWSLVYICICLILNVQQSQIDYIKILLKDIGKDIYIAVAGIAATLAGFVIAGIAVLATILPKDNFKNSVLKGYYSQIYESFHYAAMSLGSLIILGISGIILPREGLISLSIFFVCIYTCLLSAIFVKSSISIIRKLIIIDAAGIIEADTPEAEIEETDLPTQDNGDVYS